MKPLLLCLLALAFALPARAVASDDDTDRTLSPYFVVEGASPGTEPFALESTRVHANVSGVVASVVVEQTYRNRGRSPIHARYVFPASTRAAVNGMQMRVGNRRVVARISEREQARRDFEAARATGRTASLLEEHRPNVFSMSVANILPGDQVVVELRYSELLVPEEGAYEFVYPTVVGPRYSGSESTRAQAGQGGIPYLRSGVVPDTTFDFDLSLSTGMPIAEVTSPSHAVDVVREGDALARVSLTRDGDFAANRDVIVRYALRGQQIRSGLLLFEGERENHFLLMVQPPARVEATSIPPREYIFVLDVSGSMHGFPLDTAKTLIRDLIRHLRPTDTFDVVLFAGDARTLAPRSLPATEANVDRAVAFIDAESGGGGTELAAALTEATSIPRASEVSRSLVVLTDGYIAEEREAFTRIADGLGTTNVFAFGIGSGVNRHLIEGLARTGQGEPFVVTDPSQAAETARRFRRYIESPVLTRVDVRFQGFDAYDVEPRHSPDVFAERPVVVLGKWRGPRRGDIVVAGRTPSGPFETRVPVASATSRAEHDALPLLWARSRIARLDDFAVGGEDADTTREITSLGLRYSLLTRYTSFIAVLETVRNPDGNGDDVAPAQPLPLGVSELAVGGEYVSGAEPGLAVLVAMLGLVWLARTLLSRREGGAVR